MSFSKLSDEFLKQNQLQEKINWPGLMAAGLLALPGAAKSLPNQQEPPKIQKNVASKETVFKNKIKDFLRLKEGSNDYESIKQLHGQKNKNGEIVDPTIGWGHSLRYRNQSKAIFQKLFPELNFESIFDKEHPLVLSEPQTEKLLDHDVNIRYDTLMRVYPEFLNYEYDTQRALFDLVYRGDLKYNISKDLLNYDVKTAVSKLRNGVANDKDSIKKRVEDSIQILIKSPHFKKPANYVAPKPVAAKKPTPTAKKQVPAPRKVTVPKK